MVTSDLRAEVEIWPFRACAMYPAIIIRTVRSLWTWLWGRYHVPQDVFLVVVIVVVVRDSLPFFMTRALWLPLTTRTCNHSTNRFLAHVNYVVVRPSVCLLRSCALLRRLKFSAMFLRHLVRWPSVDIQVKFSGNRPREPSNGGVKL